MIKLLFVEDDTDCAYAIQGGLEMLDLYDIRYACNGVDALKIYEEFLPDVIVSDIDMPLMNGLEFAKAIRQKDSNVIIMLGTGLNSPKDVDRGYAIGIDEYVKKPFLAHEIHNRIQAILRRTQNINVESNVNINRNKNIDNKNSTESRENKLIPIGKYIFDTEANNLIYQGKISQRLTLREANILLILAENKNMLIDRSDILTKYWKDENPHFASRSLDVFISKLRKYLLSDSSIKIVNIKGKGLKLEL